MNVSSVALVAAVLVAGCATTTAPTVADATMSRRVTEPAPDPADGAPEQPAVMVEATSPTDVQFHPHGRETVVPLQPRRPAAKNRAAAIVGGMLIGAAIGIVGGALSGADQDRYERAHPEANCDPLCGGHAVIDSAMFGAIGLGIGAAGGAISGTFY